MDTNDNIQQVIAVNVRSERERKRWRQEDLSRVSGIARSGISEIEQGQRSVKVHSLRLLANALGVPIYTLVIEHSDRDYPASA